MGTWYEIARLPNSFQEGCVDTSATYTLLPDGRVEVLNRCRRGTLDGPQRQARGKARVVDAATGAKLKVTFFWPFSGDYWIIALDEDYRWVLVGTPDRRYLWILSRERTMDPGLYEELTVRARDLGFDTSRLLTTLQPG
jgi:apolipoprotein D and lipocalin family protein